MPDIAIMVARRLALGLLTLWIVSLIVFLGVALLPGDIATEILGQSATEETVAAFRRELGLNEPLHLRYADWLWGILQGDFGQSLANNRPVAELIETRLGNTLFLAVVAAAVSVPLAIGLGVIAALFRNSLFDRGINVFALTNISFPEFFVAYIMILIFAVELGWLPSLSNVGPGDSLWQRLYSVILPAATLTLIVMAHMMRMTRAAIVNLMASPYIEMAALKGLGRRRIVMRHALPNAWAPIINVVVLNLAYLVVGVVVVEVVFVYPGLGQLMVDSVSKRDIPVVQACSMVFAAAYVLLNLTADILSIVSNPRLLHPR
jgi:peptide/nickel transport system permease protein